MIAFKKPAPNVTIVTVPMSNRVDWEQWVLLRSDVHHDNPKCLWDLERKHLDMAKERNAGVLDFGDLFCAMQGKFDRRSDKSSVREEHMHENYLDRLVETAADFYEPYASQFWNFGIGNHEWSIMERHETHLTERLAQTLRVRTNATCPVGGYRGWVKLRFAMKNKQGKICDQHPFNIHYFHGTGGGGPVTRGVIQTNRDLAMVENADCIVRGHIHERWALESRRDCMTQRGMPFVKSVWHIQCPTYKNEYEGVDGVSWAIRSGHPPKPLGAWWARFYTEYVNKDRVLKVEFTPAT